jgi:serine/threonine protein kinase
MTNHTSKNPCKFKPGTVVEGKWHNQKYVLLKELGSGATGVVYLARQGNLKAALKLSSNGISITSEVNVLKSFARVQGTSLGPSLLDVDDWAIPGGMLSFYVMEYIDGLGLEEFINLKGKDWTEVLVLQLLNDLELLHKKGWVFGDLKPENLIVTGPPPRIRCIDVGGTTLIGRAIKEYTEFYDRGFWGMGSRKAEPSYDLFALAMVIISTAYPGRFKKNEGGFRQLLFAIKQKKELAEFEPVLVKALQGNYPTALQMKTDLLISMKKTGYSIRPTARYSPSGNSTGQRKSVTCPNIQQSPKQRHVIRKQKKAGGIKETFYIVSAMAILYIVYIVVQLV